MSNTVLFSEITSIRGGSGFPESYQGNNSGDYPFIKVSDMNLPANSRLIFEANNYVNKDVVSSLGLTIFPKNTLVFAKVGAAVYLNKRRLLTRETIIDNNMMGITPKRIDSEFLYQVMLNIDLAEFIQPGALPSINQEIVGKISLPRFSDKQQKKIAKILSTVDNLIEKTQSLIDKYTAVKQGMMADLFTRGIDLTPGDNYGQLRPSVTEAPELYQKTELGWVPKDWDIADLEAIATVDRGKFTHRPRDDAKCYGGLHPFIQTGSVTKAKGDFITEYRQTLSDFGRSVSREFQAGTIAVTIAANIADTGILKIPMCFPDSIVGVIVNESIATIRYVEVSIRRNKQRLDALAPLSAQKNINLEDLRPLKIALPSLDEQIELCRRYESNEKLIHKEVEYLEKLKLQKKGLMQDLLTGKVRV
jgi:type I restriction enzyme S subunit